MDEGRPGDSLWLSVIGTALVWGTVVLLVLVIAAWREVL